MDPCGGYTRVSRTYMCTYVRVNVYEDLSYGMHIFFLHGCAHGGMDVTATRHLLTRAPNWYTLLQAILQSAKCPGGDLWREGA